MTDRVDYHGKPSIGTFLIFAISLGLVAAFCLRMAWVGLFLRDGLPISLGFSAFAALMIYMIAAIGWKTFGPSMILTPNQIIHPGAFRNLRTPIGPDTQVIRWDRRYTKREHNKPGEATLKFKIETSMLLIDGGAERPRLVASTGYGNCQIERYIADLERVAGIKVQHLTPNGMVPDPPPRVADWPKRDAG